MNNDTVQDVRRDVQLAASKLGVLLAASPMPEDVKNAWIALLPEMTLEQIARLSDILEARYLDAKTEMIDVEYKKKLEELVSGFGMEDKERELSLVKQINAL